ncbi:MAG TPA: hypothetical protein VER58_14210 [Thermoanaerobaculia bacterium]|nr:hypothetical protein [Thermoanaerobaculia bacterium]
MKERRAAIGIKSKTGRAIAVVLSESTAHPEFVCRQELKLSDKKIPATMQPYHEVMEMPWSESVTAVKPAIAAIEKIAAASLRKLMDVVESRGLRVACVAVVGPKDRQLERIGNPHIRAHAAEGVLFRAVVEKAAAANDCPSRAFVDPTTELPEPSGRVKSVLAEYGKAAGSPWRADEKTAAIAAWVALATPIRPSAR